MAENENFPTGNYRHDKRFVIKQERDLRRKYRKSYKAEKTAKNKLNLRSCFWTWPFGHQCNSLVCRVCGKNRPGNAMGSGW